jgi:hypothetical protein
MASCAGGSVRRYAFAVGSNYSDDEILDGGGNGSAGGGNATSNDGFGDCTVGFDAMGTTVWRPPLLRRRKSEDYGRCSERPFGFAVEMNGCSAAAFPSTGFRLDDDDNDKEVESILPAPHHPGFDEQRSYWTATHGNNVGGGGGVCSVTQCAAMAAGRFHGVASSGSALAYQPPSSSAARCTPRDRASHVYGGGQSSGGRAMCGDRTISSALLCGCPASRCERVSGCTAAAVGDRAPMSNQYRQQFIERFSSLSHNDPSADGGGASLKKDAAAKNSGGNRPAVFDASDINRQLELCYGDGGYRERRSMALPHAYAVRNSDAEVRRYPAACNQEVVVMRRNGCVGSGGRNLPSSVVYFYERASICDPLPLPAGLPSATSSAASSCVAMDRLPPAVASAAMQSKLGNRKYRGSGRNETTATAQMMTILTEPGCDVQSSSSLTISGLRRVNSLSGSGQTPEQAVGPTTAAAVSVDRLRHHHGGGYRRYPSGCGAAADEGFGDDGRIHVAACGVESSSPGTIAVAQTTSGHVCCRCAEEARSSLATLKVTANQSSSSSSTSSIASSSSAAVSTSAAGVSATATSSISGILPSSSDRNRKRSYRVGLNLFNK